MNIDREVLIKGDNLCDKEYPTVVIKDRDISRELKGFLGRRFSVEKIFGQVLGQLGFNKDDVIVLKNMYYSRGMNSAKFEYSVNLVNDSCNKIILNYCYGHMVISNKDMDIVCECSCTSRNDIRLYLKSITERISDFKVYTRKYGYSSSEYIMNNGCDEVKLVLGREIDYDCEDLMCIENDLSIEEYFKSISCNCDIDSLYNDIKGYLGDINIYKNIRLEVNRKIDNKNVNTGLLVLENGICKEFRITRNDRCVYLNSDGDWSYNFNGRFYNIFSLGRDDRNITYSVNADNDMILKHVMDTKDYVMDVSSEVEDTKKLVRSMFNKGNK